MKILKSIGAIIAGIVFIVVTHLGADKILESLGVISPPEQGLHITWMLILVLAYRIIFQIAGGYLTAYLAPSRPMLHSIILGSIGLILTAVAAAVAIPMHLSPAWYPIALAISALPCAWLGGKLYTK